jgi:hypothetical protein
LVWICQAKCEDLVKITAERIERKGFGAGQFAEIVCRGHCLRAANKADQDYEYCDLLEESVHGKPHWRSAMNKTLR